ncbi:hypothetical protein Y032_0585g318 [Ancylostoma ceylanicum]|uniref:Uncharacterized protein n=1 Tax=Ancylostoma ceylanicum TaxID=53326 RepID=A0A016WPS2_9BILA|nr:hypothetical protein Y032_0585g318 [Ancylostoma ceylanicum]
MVLAKLYFSDEEIFEQLSRECSHLFQNGINAEVSEIVELTNGAISPFFQRRMLRCIDQLSCYRILRIDFALNEHAILKKKLIGRLELAQNVRYVIADALAYRNFAAVNLIAENAAAHLDKYSFFSGLEQIVYPMAMKLLSEATRMIFHAKPASMGWKKQSDESDRLGSKLQQHPNGYIGGLIEMWLERVALVEVADSKDVYRQRSLHSSIESIRAVLREDTTFNPICRGLLVFACDLVCSILEAIFGRPCQRIDELIENPYIDHHTGMSLVRKLTKGMLSSHADERVLNILGQLCAISIMDTPDASSHSTTDYRVPSCSRRGVLLAESAGIEGVTDYEFAQIASPLAEPNRSHTAKDVPVSKGANGSAKTSGDKQCLEEDYFRDLSHQLPRKEVEQKESGQSPSEPEVSAPDSEVLVSSERSSDQNDVLSVAPSRSVCEQVETMMAGVKYCREREHGGAGIDGKQPIKQCEAEVGPKEQDVTATDVLDEPSVDSLEHEELEAEAVDSSELNELHTDEVPPVFQQHLQDQCSQQKSKIEDTDDMKQESGQVPEAPVEAVDDTECAKIISDDHLDFSSQNPSVRTKWLSSDDFASGDNSGDATSVLLESTVSKKDDFESGPCKVTFDGRNDEHLLWEPAKGVPAPSHEETGMSGRSWNPGGAVSPGLDAEETIREKSSVGEPKGYCVVDQTTDPSALASQEQDFGSSVEEEQGISDVGAKNTAMESTKHLGGSRVQNDSPRVMSPGKAMLHKILSECAGPAVPSSKPTSKPEKCATDPGARESCFSGVSRKQSNPFPSTRGMVLSTSLESDPEFSNTSTDDDIAGCHSLGPKVAEAKAKIISDEGGQTKGKATLETEKDSAVLDSSGAVHAAPLDTDVWEDVAETPSSQGDSLKCESYASTKDRVGSVPEHVPKAKDSTVSAGSGFESEITMSNSPNRDTSERGTPSRDSCQKARRDLEERGDVRHRPSRLEPIHEQEAMESSDVEDARATAQKKFLSGGFDSSTSSGFGGFVSFDFYSM